MTQNQALLVLIEVEWHAIERSIGPCFMMTETDLSYLEQKRKSE